MRLPSGTRLAILTALCTGLLLCAAAPVLAASSPSARDQRAPAVGDRAARALGERFGGVWIDARSGRVKVGVVGSGAGSRAKGRSAIARTGLAGSADVVAVRYGEQHLQNVLDWLANRFAVANRGASESLVAGLRTDVNAVELQVPRGASLTPAQSSLVAAARERFGAALHVASYAGSFRTRACTYPYCDAPLRSGIAIFDPNFLCTGGFLARSRTDGALFQLTAGHCRTGANWQTRFAGGSVHTIGPFHNAVYGSEGDAGILRVLNPRGWAARAWVEVTGGPDTSPDPQYAIRGDGRSTVGMRICTSGARFGRSDCGTVTQIGVTTTDRETGVTVRGLGRANFCGVGGDSGAPVYAGHTAYGLQQGGFSMCDSTYEGIGGAEDLMNVTVSHDRG